MKPVLCLALQSCGKNFAHKRVVVPIEDHGTVVVLKMSIQILVSLVRSEVRHSEPVRWIFPLDLIREWQHAYVVHVSSKRIVSNPVTLEIMQSFCHEPLNFFLNLPLLGQWNFRLPPVVTYGSGPLFPMLDLSTSWLRCMSHVPSRRTSCSQAAS